MDQSPVTYVRHAMAVQVEGAHPTEWELDGFGRESARAMARRLELPGGIGALIASTEPKALGTAEAIAEVWETEVVADPLLREAVRPWIGPGYRAVVHRYLRGELPEGWEPHGEVAGRMRAAVEAARAVAGARAIVVVSHGLALSVHLGDRLGPEFDREGFWSSLSFPDAWVLDGGLLHRPATDVQPSPHQAASTGP